MKIIILGAGRRGIRLARRLVEEKKDVIIIDENPTAVEKAMRTVDCLGYTCTATNVDELKEAGVEGADAFIALTGSDETNLVSCGIVSSSFNVPITIASVSNLSYTKTDSIMGITHIVNPYQEVASYIHNEIEQGVFSDIISFNNSQLVLYNVYIDKKSKFAGKVLKKIRSVVSGEYIVAALSRNGVAIVPDGDTVIQEGDTISIVVQQENLEDLLSTAGKRRKKPKKIAIVGSTKVTDLLLREFSEKGRSRITVIAKDKQACIDLSEKYPDTLIVNDNIASEGVFKQEGLENFDLFVGITDSDELNLISASYAKSLGITTSLALLTKTPDYAMMTKHLSIDSVVSSQDVTADAIAKYLHGSSISSMHSLFGGSIQAFEISVSENNKLVSKQLKDIDMKGIGIIAGAVKQDGTTVIPSGSYKVEAGDTLILIVERKSVEIGHQILGIEKED